MREKLRLTKKICTNMPNNGSILCNQWLWHMIHIFLFRVLSYFYVGSMFLRRCLHLTRSSSPYNSLSNKLFLMLSNHLRFGLPLLLFPGSSIPITLLPTYSSSLLNTCPYHFNLLCVIQIVNTLSRKKKCLKSFLNCVWLQLHVYMIFQSCTVSTGQMMTWSWRVFRNSVNSRPTFHRTCR